MLTKFTLFLLLTPLKSALTFLFPPNSVSSSFLLVNFHLLIIHKVQKYCLYFNVYETSTRVWSCTRGQTFKENWLCLPQRPSAVISFWTRVQAHEPFLFHDVIFIGLSLHKAYVKATMVPVRSWVPGSIMSRIHRFTLIFPAHLVLTSLPLFHNGFWVLGEKECHVGYYQVNYILSMVHTWQWLTLWSVKYSA